jgi:glutathione S-transferase
MLVLHYASIDPHSRFVRLALAEHGLEAEFIEERLSERRRELLELNPAGTLPVLRDNDAVICGANVIADYLDETRGQELGSRRLLPGNPVERAEVRRLLHWFNGKFYDEVTNYLVTEKFIKRARIGGDAAPDVTAIRAAKANIRYHLRYISHLVSKRDFLGGDWLSFADFAAAAHLSSADYFGDVPWDEELNAKSWYARIKSRPGFRPLLSERIPGVPPPPHYADLDF